MKRLTFWRLSVLLLLLPMPANALELLKTKLCTGVERRNPVGVTDHFDPQLGKVWVHMTFRNDGEPTEATVIWRHGDDAIARVPINIGTSGRWRTWARISISDQTTGGWSVEVLDAEGRRLTWRAFTVGDGPAPKTERPEPEVEIIEAPPPLPKAAPAPARQTLPPAVEVLNTPDQAAVEAMPNSTDGCRALASIRVDSDPRPRYLTVALDLKDGVKIQKTPGLMVKQGTETHVLAIVHQAERESGKGGDVIRHWDSLVGQQLPDGEARTWFTVPATLSPPGRSRDDSQHFLEDNLIEIRGVLGGLVSLHVNLSGYAGGLHGFDHSRYAMLKTPGVMIDASKIVGSQLIDRARERVAEVRGRGADNPPDIKGHDYRRSAIAPTQEGLSLFTLMRCCSWADGHGMMEVDIPLKTPPEALQPFAPAKGGWYFGPNGCGSVGVEDGRLHARSGGGRAVRIKTAGNIHLLGVRWLHRREKPNLRAAKTAWTSLVKP